MTDRTVIQLVHRVHAHGVATGMDLSVKDVAFLLSIFFEGMIDTEHPAPTDKWMQVMADEILTAKDEV